MISNNIISRLGAGDMHLLFMVFCIFLNLETAIDLFKEHYSCKLVRECHLRHGKPQVTSFFDLVSDAERRADNKINCIVSLKCITV